MAVEPPPPVITRSPETQALLELAAATSRTDAAWEALHAADVARIRADEEYQLAHQQLAGAIATVTDVLGPAWPLASPPARKRVLVDEPSLGEELQEAHETTAVAAALRDDRLGEEPDDAPEVVTRRPEPKPAAGGGPGRPAYVARMLNAMVDAGGDFTVAADALQIKRSSLVGSMSVLRSRTDLTEAEAAAIARTRVRKA
jgi:hypothetical protein